MNNRPLLDEPPAAYPIWQHMIHMTCPRTEISNFITSSPQKTIDRLLLKLRVTNLNKIGEAHLRLIRLATPTLGLGDTYSWKKMKVDFSQHGTGLGLCVLEAFSTFLQYSCANVFAPIMTLFGGNIITLLDCGYWNNSLETCFCLGFRHDGKLVSDSRGEDSIHGNRGRK